MTLEQIIERDRELCNQHIKCKNGAIVHFIARQLAGEKMRYIDALEVAMAHAKREAPHRYHELEEKVKEILE